MKVLVHCIYFPPEIGGLESHVFYLCKALAERGHQVEVVTSRSKPEFPREEVVEGVRVFRTWFPGRNPLGWGLHALGSLPELIRRAADADIVHAQAFSSIFPCAIAARHRNLPLVSTLHTSHFLTYATSPLWKSFLGWSVRTSDHALAASREIADVAEGLAPGVSVEALTNGVDTSSFKPVSPTLERAEGYRLIVPRRLFPKNGVEYFIRAMPIILDRLASSVHAILIGDGPERGRLEELARELGVGEAVSFLGARPNTDMPGLLSSGDLAIFPSLMEATSVAALESMACELPVAASNVGGLPEIVNEEVGGIFEPANPDSLAGKVVELLQRPDLEELGARGRARVVTEWSNDRLAERHLEIYERLVEEKGAGTE